MKVHYQVMAVTDPRLTEELHPPFSDADAIVEADRCLLCGGGSAVAPCQAACPANVNIPKFIALVAEGQPEAAAQVVWQMNLLGATCAQVCPVAELCEGACVLPSIDRAPIAIAALQRHATTAGLAAG